MKLFHDGVPYHIETSSMDWFLYDKDLCHERLITNFIYSNGFVSVGKIVFIQKRCSNKENIHIRWRKNLMFYI